MSEHEIDNSIAIIGLSGRFPDANHIDEYWNNIRSGHEAIHPLTDDRLRELGVSEAKIQHPRYVKWSSSITGTDQFDYTFFDMNKREASMMDPQHRLMLTCAYEALEDGGYHGDLYDGIISVFAGCGFNSYLIREIMSKQDEIPEEDLQLLLQTNSNDYLSSRISYKLNLRGSSVAVQTACSTSLVAVHQACQNLLMYQSDMALAGGVSLRIPETEGYMYQEGGIFSPDGHCRAFDAEAQGTVFGSGVGMVLLKRLEDALTDHDHIYAVIRGSAVNNDGSGKVGYTAPSVDGQRDVIREALMMADIDPATISYIEAHGTGTVLGDPIEMTALQEAFGDSGTQHCAIGAVKTNIGHLNAASGIAGLIKTVLMLQHRELPPTLHYNRANPAINFKSSPFYVNTTHQPWEVENHPLRAGVSSFGIGGTNAHLILEEAPFSEDNEQHLLSARENRVEELIIHSARTPDAVETMIHNMNQFIKNHPDLDRQNAAYTLQVGRKEYPYRSILLWHTDGQLQSIHQRKINDSSALVFMFPGQGSQYKKMAAGLYEEVPLFRAIMDDCLSVLATVDSIDLKSIMLGTYLEGIDLQNTSIAQPFLFTIEYALAKCFIQLGIHPAAMIGHSLGEYTAACLSGVLTLQDAMRLVCARGQLMQQSPVGQMISILATEAEIRPLLSESVFISAMNSSTSCTVAGTPDDMQDFLKRLDEAGYAYKLLAVNHGFHTPLMESMIEPFAKVISTCTFNIPTIPYISNVTGTWITSEQAQNPSYWLDHLLQPVQFEKGLQTLLDHNDYTWLEMGPGKALSQFLRQHIATSESLNVYSLMRREQESTTDRSVFLKALGQCWLIGQCIDWKLLHDEHAGRISLPLYPFENKRCWFEPHIDQQESLSYSHKDAEEVSDSRAYLSSTYEPAQDQIQQNLVNIWEQILGVHPIGIKDDFFELGGHSLLATQIISRLRNLLPDIDIQFDRLFAYPTIEGISEQIELQMIEYLETKA